MSRPRDPKRLVRLLAIYERAAQLEGAEREAYLDEACGGDATLRVEVEVLLADRDADDADFLEPPPPVEGSGAVAPDGADGEGFRLGDFEILRELGRGGAGVVYLARQVSLERLVALKVLSTNVTTTPEQVERFHRESRAVAKVEHPGIVHLYADGSEGPNHWFAMEFVDGRDLETELECQRTGSVLPDEQPFLPRPGEREHAARVARVVADAARALEAAHRAGVVHRDVKPSNLLLDREGAVHLVDFGLARDASLGSITRTKQIAGTVHYMSPEQALVERAAVDHRTDVYSLGVVLYEMLTLRRPFTGRTDLAVFERIRKGDPRPIRTFNKGVPRDLETVCAKAMSIGVDDRYATAGDFAADLERFLAHEAIEARAQTPLDRARRWTRRNRVALAVAAAVVLLVLFASERARREALRGRLAQVAFTVTSTDDRFDGTGDGTVDGTLFVRALDRASGNAGERRRLGRLGQGPFELDPGFYRFELELELGAGRRTWSDWLDAGEVLEVELDADGPRGTGGDGSVGPDEMVPVDGGWLLLTERSMPFPLREGRTRIEPFEMDRHEVTNAQFRAFARATGRTMPAYLEDLPPEYDDRPVVRVTWEDAVAYAAWVGKRLPTIAEWLWAARGESLRLYPWGDEIGEREGVSQGERHGLGSMDLWERDYFRYTLPVDTRDDLATPSGIRHLFGNVAEWTESPVVTPLGGDEGYEPFGDGLRTLGGTNWIGADLGPELPAMTLAWGNHQHNGEPGRSWTVGFRCVRDLK